MRLALNGGAYEAASIIAGAQRCVNLYQEINQKETDPPVPITHYPCPGSIFAKQGDGSVWRGLYEATNSQVFGVLDQTLYYIDSNWNLTVIGNVGVGTTPVSMYDNSYNLFIVTGTSGYTMDLNTHIMTTYALADNFLNADKVVYMDTFTIFNQPGTKNFYTTLSNSTAIDPTYIAAKTSSPDLLQTVATAKHELYLIGTKTTEIWYDAGGAAFPFQELQGTLIEQGTCAKYSPATHDNKLFFISRNKDGQATALMTEHYVTTKISTPAIDNEWSSYNNISDAISMTYQQRGHTFWMVTFPSADKTWVFDINTALWHERVWLDDNGMEHRHRANCISPAYGKILLGDFANGKLYTFSTTVFQDDSKPMTFRRGFPHLLNDGFRVEYTAFIADVECGQPSADGTYSIFLQWSDDRGRTFGNPLEQGFGAPGQYLTQPQWSRLGLARDRVFELFWSSAVYTALNGAFVEAKPLNQ